MEKAQLAYDNSRVGGTAHMVANDMDLRAFQLQVARLEQMEAVGDIQSSASTMSTSQGTGPLTE